MMKSSALDDCLDTSHNENSSTTGTLTSWARLANITDHKSWMNEIQHNGHKPDDWLFYLHYIEENCGVQNQHEKLLYMDQAYRKARENIPMENNLTNQALVTIFLNSAQVKLKLGSHLKARYLLRYARANFKGIPRVHLAAAQFELDQGDKAKCISILEKANAICPHERKISVALQRARAGLETLDDQKEADVFTEPIPVSDSVSKLVLTETSKEDQQKQQGTDTSNLYNQTDSTQEGGFKHASNSAFTRVPSNNGEGPPPGPSAHGVGHIQSTPVQRIRSGQYSTGAALSIDRLNSASGFKRPGSCSRTTRPPQRVIRQKLVLKKGGTSEDDDDEDDEEDIGSLENSVKPLETSPTESSMQSQVPAHLSVITEDGDSGIAVATPPTDDLKETAASESKFSFPLEPERSTEPKKMDSKELEKPQIPPQQVGQDEIDNPGTNLSRPPGQVNVPLQTSSTVPPPMQPPLQSHPPVMYSQPVVSHNAPERKDQIHIKGVTYTIIKVIGKGGSSKVYQVLHEDSKKIFAVKYVDLECSDDQIVQSYKNEITVLRRLQNKEPIIKLYDFEITPSHIYLVMECGSIDLASFLRKKRVIKDDILFYWRQMLTAVQCIHDEGIIHRDLKPANFLFVEGSLKLIDFGIANAIQSDKTSVTRESQVGTLNYMSPETIRGSDGSQGNGSSNMKINCKSDVWSLGCILYYIIYGKTPFQSITNTMMKLQAICNKDYQIQFPDVGDPLLTDVVKSCLVRDVRKRPSIKDLLSHPYVSSRNVSKESPKPVATMKDSEVMNLMSKLTTTHCSSPRSLELAMALQKYLGSHSDGQRQGKENRHPLQDVNTNSQPHKGTNPMSMFFSDQL